MQNKPCFSLFIRFSCMFTPILLPSGKPFCTADGPLSFFVLLKCSFLLLFVHVTTPSSIIFMSPSQPAIFSMALSSMAVLLFAFYKACFLFFNDFSFPSDSIALSSSSEPFFSLFHTFTSACHTLHAMCCKPSVHNTICSVCLERFPSIKTDEAGVWNRYHADSEVSAANNMDPGTVPPELCVCKFMYISI